MAKNRILLPKTVIDIDGRVDRVLRGLGNPEPPLRLEDVRELLKLDRAFYTADNPGAVRESISRIRVATVQVFKRPTLLLDVITKLSLKALYLPDRRRILLDGNLPPIKHRWNEAHEVGHSLLPWHEDVMHGDDTQTLSRECHEEIEAEANFTAGRLLFLLDRFAKEACDSAPSLAIVQGLNKSFGNTMSSTLYRYVETVGDDRPVVGLISVHPHPAKRKAGHNPAQPCRHFIQSKAFARMFSKIREHDVFAMLATYCGHQKGGPLGAAELVLTDDNGDEHVFDFETFYNRHEALTLGVHQAARPRQVTFAKPMRWIG